MLQDEYGYIVWNTYGYYPLGVFMKSTINLDDTLYKNVQDYCTKKGYTVNGLIRVMLIEKMESEHIGK